ncbi:MAG TPA: DUF721 domain-containing protein [Candidatus Nanopelagicaceae bacterium]|nr:DUF721 domain-containing protein [Candidatus Nanopelagicaceae bacterium]
MERIEEILPRVLRRLGGTRQVRQARVEEALGRVCGDYLRAHIRVVAVEGTTLVVACAHPAIAHQLQMDSARVLDQINTNLPDPQLKRLRFVTESG